MGALLQDLRYGARMLLKQPAFTGIAILTLALGIGANSAIFSVVNAVLLRPLPFAEPERIVKVWETFASSGLGSARGFGSVSAPNLKDWREQNDVFTHIAAYQLASFNLQSEERPERISAAMVSANFFDLLGVPPQLGRTFLEGEDEEGNHRVVVLSDRLWQQNFGTVKDIVNREISLGGEKFTVIGVMPPDFRFPSQAIELWVPLAFSPQQMASRGNHAFLALGRLKPDATIERAQEQMSIIARRLEEQYPEAQAERGIILVPLHEETVRRARPALLVLLGSVGFVLLIACANVANLLLARAAGRRREIAIRAAIGAGRGRLMRQFLTESLILAIAGGALGLLLAVWGLDALMTLAANSLPRSSEVGLDGRVAGFTMLLALLTGVGFGLAPAFQVSKTDVQEALKDGGSSGTGPRRNRLRSILVVAEVSLALMLLVGAGLLIKSFLYLQQMDTGLRPENVLTMRLSLSTTKYPESAASIPFYDQILEKVSALPGVEAAGFINMLPLQNWGFNGDIEIEGQGPYQPGQAPLAEWRTVSPNYFRAMGIPLIAGRFFDQQDSEQSTPAVIVNQTLARQHFSNQDAIGKRLRTGEEWMTIVGVVGDVRQSGLTQPVRPEIYFPHTQVPRLTMSLVARSASNPENLTSAIRAEVSALDPTQPIYSVQKMEEVIAGSVSDHRFNMLLLTIFAAVAIILAVTGIYSVMSYTVTQHTREIGLRMALGAQRSDVLKLVVGQGMMLAFVGVGVGIAGALALTRLMEILLYGVTATDALTFAGVSLLLLIVALVACFVPAQRATKVDPMIALRYE